MKKTTSTASIGIAIASSSIAMIAHAQTIATGPYYATPSWDQTLPAASCFAVLSNFNFEAVLDRETGLVWQRLPHSNNSNNVQVTYPQAQLICGRESTGKRYGWRLPTRSELSSLLDADATTSPALPDGAPFVQVLGSGFYWTSTPWVGDTEPSHLYVFLSHSVKQPTTGPVGDQLPGPVWCVRGPSAAGAD